MEKREEDRRNYRRHIALRISQCVRTVTMVVLCALLVVQVGTQPALYRTGLVFCSTLIAGVVVVQFASVAVEILLYALLTKYVMRVPSVQWLRVSQCTNLWNWMSHAWSFYNNGPQRGYRVLGLDIVTSGRL